MEFSQNVTPLRGNKVSRLTHTYPHKPTRKIEVTTCCHQADSPLFMWPDVWSGDLKNMVIHDTKCPYWSLNNTNQSLLLTFWFYAAEVAQSKLLLVLKAIVRRKDNSSIKDLYGEHYHVTYYRMIQLVLGKVKQILLTSEIFAHKANYILLCVKIISLSKVFHFPREPNCWNLHNAILGKQYYWG